MSDEDDEALVLRAVMRLGKRLRQASPAREVSGGALAVLIALHREGDLAAAALARVLELQPQSLTRLLARMEGDAMIERRADPADRRLRVVALTDRGRGALGWAMEQRRRWLQAVAADRLDADERAALVAGARVMLKLAL